MPCRSTLSRPVRAASALLAAGLFCTFANATPRPLAESEMSDVRGADGSILAGLSGSTSSSQNGFANGLAAAFSSSTGATLLTPDQFAASLASVGLTLDSMPDYHGEAVLQTVVDAKPVSFTFTLSDVLRGATGLQFNSGGASLGTFTMNSFDARGTTIWVWQHH